MRWSSLRAAMRVRAKTCSRAAAWSCGVTRTYRPLLDLSRHGSDLVTQQVSHRARRRLDACVELRECPVRSPRCPQLAGERSPSRSSRSLSGPSSEGADLLHRAGCDCHASRAIWARGATELVRAAASPGWHLRAAPGTSSTPSCPSSRDRGLTGVHGARGPLVPVDGENDRWAHRQTSARAPPDHNWPSYRSTADNAAALPPRGRRGSAVGCSEWRC